MLTKFLTILNSILFFTFFCINANAQFGNTFYGAGAGANNSSDFNSFFGHYAGNQNTIGKRNTCFGAFAGQSITSGRQNIFMGVNSGRINSTGEKNVFVGDDSGRNNSTGSNNIGIGQSALFENGSTNHNIGLGNMSLRYLTIGTDNIAVGNNALYNLGTGDNNIAMGRYAGTSLTAGNNNTFLGVGAGQNSTNGTGNVFVGFRAGHYETGSNKLYIANNLFDTNLLVYGDFATQQLAIGTKNIPTNILTSQGDNYTLFVPRGILTDEVKVKTGWADYVFEEDFDLPSIEDEMEFVDKNGHLMSFPSAEEIEDQGGVDVGKMMIAQQEMIEKLMLYVADLKSEINELNSKK